MHMRRKKYSIDRLFDWIKKEWIGWHSSYSGIWNVGINSRSIDFLLMGFFKLNHCDLIHNIVYVNLEFIFLLYIYLLLFYLII